MQIDLFDTNTKYCKKCKKEKPKTEFYKNKNIKDGLRNDCKLCQKKYYETNKDRIREYREANKDKIREYKKEYDETNKDRIREYKKHYREANKDKIREYYEANKDRILEYKKHYREANKHLRNAWEAKRRAVKLEATPDWLTEDQYNQMKDMYWLAQDLKKITGEDYHVDHIIPLQGEEVRGLHVPWNLQVLPADINLSKGNRLDDGSTET